MQVQIDGEKIQVMQVQIDGEKILLRGMVNTYKLTPKEAHELGRQLIEAELKIRTRFAAVPGKHYVGKNRDGEEDIFYCSGDGRFWRLLTDDHGNGSTYYSGGSHHLWCDDYGYTFKPLNTFESGHL